MNIPKSNNETPKFDAVPVLRILDTEHSSYTDEYLHNKNVNWFSPIQYYISNTVNQGRSHKDACY